MSVFMNKLESRLGDVLADLGGLIQEEMVAFCFSFGMVSL